MRWLVEVSSVGKTDLQQKICVEAESWQRALQAARAQRGEEGPMSGFSIELLEEGYRAVDPIARTRFVVKRTTEDTPLTVASPGKPGSATASSAPPAPSSSLPMSVKAPKAPVSSSPMGVESSGPKSIPRPGGAGPASVPPRKTSMTPPPPAASTAPAASSALAVGASTPGLPPVKLLTSREQNPTEASPLTYREYAFAVPPGTSEEVGLAVLRAQLKLVEAQVEGAKMGKLVNLAVFDAEFTGKPPAPPLATLTWKDWKGDPVIGYPRRGGASMAPKPPGPSLMPSAPPPPVSAPPSMLVPPAPAVPSVSSVAPVQVVQPISAGPTFPSSGPPSNRAPTSVRPPPPATNPFSTAPSAPPPPMSSAPAPSVALPPPPVPSVPPPVVAPVATFTPSAPPPAMKPASAPPPPAAFPEPVIASVPALPSDGSVEALIRTPSGRFVRGRTVGDELISALFESMHDLHFLRDALDGGQFCLALATEVLPARAALIHFFDVEKREWVIACTRGKDTSKLLATRAGETDELLREAARKRSAVVLPDATMAAAARYSAIGGTRSLIVAPIMQAGRALGALEIINPLDGNPFNEGEGNAMTYIAEQFAEYLGSRGIVLDKAKIQASSRS